MPFRAPALMLLPLALFSRNEKTRENSTTADVKQARGRVNADARYVPYYFLFLTLARAIFSFFKSLCLLKKNAHSLNDRNCEKCQLPPAAFVQSAIKKYVS